MNSKHPSENRNEWTTRSLNFSLPIMQSIKQLVNTTESAAKPYQKDTLSNSELLYTSIRSKFGVWEEEVEMECDFDPFFFESDLNTPLSHESPSVLLNDAYMHVHAFVHKQFQQITEDFDIITANLDNIEDEHETDNETELNL